MILSASYGEGHQQAALAVQRALRDRQPNLKTAVIDYFSLVGRAFNRLVQGAYLGSVRHAPWAYGFFYRATGNIRPDSVWQRRLNHLGRDGVLRLIAELRPRVILSTYPTPSGVLSDLRREGLCSAPVATVITDYVVHSQWIHPGVDLYCVGAETVATGLIGRKIPSDRIAVTGIPVRSEFSTPLSPEEARRRFGLEPGRPTLLVMGGGFGLLEGLEELIRRLAGPGRLGQVAVVTGRNKVLANKLSSLAAAEFPGARIFGFVEEVAALMAASDLLLTKPGGLTVAEALAMGLPLVLRRPVPGQEEGNARLLLAEGAAIQPSRVDLAGQVEELLGRADRRAEMALAARRLGRPEAAGAVAERLLRWLEKPA